MRKLLSAILVPTVFVLGGCPLYGSDTYYSSSSGSMGGNSNVACAKTSDCLDGQECSSAGTCANAKCDVVGCASGFTCVLTSGEPVCQVVTGPDGGKSDAGKPACERDVDCSALGASAKCLSGACAAAQDQCSDATQCRTGQQCVDGVCTPSCSVSKPCPTGFACGANGVCSNNPSACTSDGACGAGNTCVEEHCVPNCGSGNKCGADLVCVDGGCVPDERPIFSCAVDGQAGNGQSGSCAVGSVCLRKSCYIACDAVDANICSGADRFNLCKSVTTTSGEHKVCGSATNLGSECDPSVGKACANAKVCIDGFCR